MNADCAFQIGASHSVCQDYARAWSRRPAAAAQGSGRQLAPYVILSDGCSSSPDTDFGARLLVKAAEQTLRDHGDIPARGTAAFHREAARRALAWAESAGLPPQAVDATLLTAHLGGEELILGCSGDGVICLQSRAGDLDVYTVSYPSGYPVYPGYAHQPERLLALEAAAPQGKEVRHFRSPSVEERLRLVGVTGGDSLTEVLAVNASDYEYAALLTDGIHSFLRAGRAAAGAHAESIPTDEALRALVSFKSNGGSFVGRRAKRFRKDCQAWGWRHEDDLAVGALHLGGW